MYIKLLQPNEVKENYVNWLLDKEVIKYSENQYRSITLEGQIIYVENCLKDKDISLYGIFEDSKHIGNITLIGLTSLHKRAELTYLIGDKNFWGQGIAKRAIAEIIKISRADYKLNKLFAGISSHNIASKKVLESNNFVLEGVRRNHLYFNNKFEDQLDYGLIL